MGNAEGPFLGSDPFRLSTQDIISNIKYILSRIRLKFKYTGPACASSQMVPTTPGYKRMMLFSIFQITRGVIKNVREIYEIEWVDKRWLVFTSRGFLITRPSNHHQHRSFGR